jgi:hypothetical protein
MSNDTTTTKSRPSHRLFSVTKDAEGKAKWDEIGALWPHKDSQGFNLKLSKLPAEGTDLVIRVAGAKKGGAQ